MSGFTVGVVGAGIAGLAVAIALERVGHHVTVYEQADRFGRVGAAINMAPNAVHALDGLGVGNQIRARAYSPRGRISREWQTGAELSRVTLRSPSDQQFGAPMLLMHRADLLSVLEGACHSPVCFGRRLESLREDHTGVTLIFADGSTQRANLVVGGDGIHSAARRHLADESAPTFTGAVAYRAFARIPPSAPDDIRWFTKWWGPRPEWELVTFPISADELFIFGSVPQATWTTESWSQSSSPAELQGWFAEFHPDARRPLAACYGVSKTAMYIHAPLARWRSEHVVLAGDACHPMTPYLAQGAATALEDAAVLSRCLAHASTCDLPDALARYERTRAARATDIQRLSSANKLATSETALATIYRYNPWTVPLGVDARLTV